MMDKSEDIYIKKEFKLHLIYWAVIFFLLAIFLLLIAPGCVNPKAFENFSFASTIVSIVLAVVSIVYSFRTKSNSSENMAGIRAIEESIDDKLLKLDALGERISQEVDSAICTGIEKAISGLKEDVSNIIEDQADIKQNLTIISEEQKKFFSPVESSTDASYSASNSFVGDLALYMAIMSFGNNKDIDLAKIDEDLMSDNDYYWGYYTGVSFAKEAQFDYTMKERGIYHIDKFDSKELGDAAYWKNKVLGYKKKEIATRLVNAIESFFLKEASSEDVKNEKE